MLPLGSVVAVAWPCGRFPLFPPSCFPECMGLAVVSPLVSLPSLFLASQEQFSHGAVEDLTTGSPRDPEVGKGDPTLS